MDTIKSRATGQELPPPRIDEDAEAGPFLSAEISGERRSIYDFASNSASASIVKNYTKQPISITAAAAHARITIFILLAIVAAAYMFIDPVSS
jgi:hypothetical protein